MAQPACRSGFYCPDAPGGTWRIPMRSARKPNRGKPKKAQTFLSTKRKPQKDASGGPFYAVVSVKVVADNNIVKSEISEISVIFSKSQEKWFANAKYRV